METFQQSILVLTLLVTAVAAIAQCWNAIETRRLVNISQMSLPNASISAPRVSNDKWEEFTFSFEVQNVGGGLLSIERIDFTWWRVANSGSGRKVISVAAAYPVMIEASKKHTFTVEKIKLIDDTKPVHPMNLPPSQSIEGMLLCVFVGGKPIEVHCHFA